MVNISIPVPFFVPNGSKAATLLESPDARKSISRLHLLQGEALSAVASIEQIKGSVVAIRTPNGTRLGKRNRDTMLDGPDKIRTVLFFSLSESPEREKEEQKSLVALEKKAKYRKTSEVKPIAKYVAARSGTRSLHPTQIQVMQENAATHLKAKLASLKITINLAITPWHWAHQQMFAFMPQNLNPQVAENLFAASSGANYKMLPLEMLCKVRAANGETVTSKVSLTVLKDVDIVTGILQEITVNIKGKKLILSKKISAFELSRTPRTEYTAIAASLRFTTSTTHATKNFFTKSYETPSAKYKVPALRA